ncbi:MAG: hypothetical protein LBP23_02805, partial [Treponema sp.]|nr:hypothetical protein [Treponema sp.]
SLSREIEEDTGAIQNFFAELESRFSEALREEAVRRSFLPNQSAEDIFERSRRFGVLMETLGGLQSIRFVDEGGLRIHFSTRPQDILNQDRLSVAYRNYDTIPDVLPFDQVAVQASGAVKYTLDGTGDRIVLSFPFYDSFEVYRGTALFSVSTRAVTERFISTGRIKVGDDISVVSEPPGIVIGVPRSAERAILSAVASVWQDHIVSLTSLNSTESGVTLALISSRTDQGILTGRLVNETLFAFPNTMKAILLTAFFLTIYLVVFLFFNIRQDTMTIVQDRLKNLQISLIEQYYDRKGDVDWNHWSQELEQRREDIRLEVKRGIKTRKGQRAEEDIDSLIDKSWDELLTVIGNRRQSSGIDEEKLQNILNRILRAVPGLPAAGSAGAAQAGPAITQTAGGAPVEGAAEELIEEAEAVEDAETVEELGDAEELIEEAEAVEDVETVEELGDAEELTEEAEEDAETVEELGDADESAEEPETVEELDAAGKAEGLAEEPETLEELGDAEAVEEPGETVPAVKPDGESGGETDESPEAAASSGSGLLAAAGKRKTSNIKLAFGDDDIPYIVETSGLELADEDIDAALNNARVDDEPAVLEELEELDEEGTGAPDQDGELEELEEIPADQQGLSPLDINNIASRIEFSDPVEAKDGDNILREDLEIISPFTTMLSNITQEKTGDGEEEIPGPSAEGRPDKADPETDRGDEKKNLNKGQ